MFYRNYSNLCRTIVTASAMFVLLTPAWGDDPVPQQQEAAQPTTKPTQPSQQPQLAPRDAYIQPRPQPQYPPQPQSIGPIEPQQITQQIQNQSKHLLANPQPQLPPQPQIAGWAAPTHQNRLQQIQQQLAANQQQLELARNALKWQQRPDLPQLENGILNAYRLKHVNPTLLAETLEKFLGHNQLRLVPDQENKILLAYSTEQVAEQISKLVDVIDSDPNISANQTADTQPAKSLMLRVFWLVDDDSTPIQYIAPEEYLPTSVIHAVKKLGILSPRLITQNSISIFAEVGEGTEFRFNFPAIVHSEPTQFQSHGWLHVQQKEAGDGITPIIEIEVDVEGSPTPISIAGKLEAPLDHFMVLGTTNFAAEQIGETRFAFVVQVIEAESFAPEE